MVWAEYPGPVGVQCLEPGDRRFRVSASPRPVREVPARGQSAGVVDARDAGTHRQQGLELGHRRLHVAALATPAGKPAPDHVVDAWSGPSGQVDSIFV